MKSHGGKAKTCGVYLIALIVLCGALLLITVPGCGQGDSGDRSAIEQQRSPVPATDSSQRKEDAPFVIGVLYWSMNIPGQVAMRTGLEAVVEKINAEASGSSLPAVELVPNVAGDGEEGSERQIEQMNELVRQKVDLIIAQPTDIAALSQSLKMANQAGIPVVAYDQHILGGQLVCFLTSDNYRAGFLGGEYVAASFPADRDVCVVLVEYPHVSSTVARVNGFIDALESYHQTYNILKTYIAVEPIGGAKAGAEILRDYPQRGTIDVIFAVNDGGGLAVVKALEDAGRDEIFFACIDGDPLSVENIRRGGIIRIDCAQFCGELGAETMRTAYRLLLGEEIGEEILIPVFPITRETVDMYHGWTAPMPEPFRKPWQSTSPQWTGEVTNIKRREQ
ncbi:MAG: sugar ABC transporter substrate-binding protein [bacterium]|nr:sugar ABC transporter substrate-binding protein [bacterium]